MAFVRYPEGREPDYDRSGVIDQSDLAILLQPRNQPAGPGDPRDLDRDGRITALDARKLVLRCDYPSCASGLPPHPDPEIFFLHPDHLGTPRMLTDAAQTPVWRWDSDPFGTTKPDEDPDGDGIPLTYQGRFPGQYYDGETGLHYNLNRYYDPTIGRYRESDPIGLEGGINTYAYALSDPLKYTDPNGLEALMCQGTLISYPHSWLCAYGVCGGLYPDPDNVWWGTGRVAKDPLKPAMCKPIDERNKCDQQNLEQCIAQENKIGRNHFYSFPLYNCRDWQNDVIRRCKAEWCPGG